MRLTSPPSDPLDDPLRNAWVGCLWPVARNLLLTAVTLLIAGAAGLYLKSFLVFVVCAIALVGIHESMRRRWWKAKEDAASARFWGIDRDGS